MKKTTAAIIALALLFIGLIIMDNLVNWSWYWKLLVAVGPAVLPFLFTKKSSATPAGTCSTPRASNAEVIDQITTSLLSLLFAAALIYGVYLGISSLWNWGTQIDSTQTRVVENGFPRHDAKYPPTRTERSFRKTFQAGETSTVFSATEGEYFRVYRMDKPIRTRMKHPEVLGWDTITRPGRFRMDKTGTLEVFSPEGPNTVEIGRTR